MSDVILGNAQSDVVQGGQVVLGQMFETYMGSGQQADASGVTIGIAAAPPPAGGTGTPLAPTSAGVVALSTSLYQYTWACAASQAPGDYLVTWAGTVGGTVLTYVQTVTVAGIATGTPAPGVYANLAQYQAWSGDTVTPAPIVQVMLQRASEALDHYLIAAVYQVNANGMPTAPMVIDAFMRACCAQCQFMLADNDPAGVKRQYTSTSMGGVTVARAPAMTAMTFPPLAPQAAAILHTAGVLGSAALINW